VHGETGAPLAMRACCDVDHAQTIGHVGLGSATGKTRQGRSADVLGDGDAVTVEVDEAVELEEAVRVRVAVLDAVLLLVDEAVLVPVPVDEDVLDLVEVAVGVLVPELLPVPVLLLVPDDVAVEVEEEVAEGLEREQYRYRRHKQHMSANTKPRHTMQ
jgi:hypothetical protein